MELVQGAGNESGSTTVKVRLQLLVTFGGFSVTNERFNLCAGPQAMDRWDCNEAEAFIQVFIRRASFKQGEGDQVQLSLQHHDQLSVSANRSTGVHQALSDRRITVKMHKPKVTCTLCRFWFKFPTTTALSSLPPTYIDRRAMAHKGRTHPLHGCDEQIIKCSKGRLSQVAGATRQGRVTVFGRWHGVAEQAGHALTAPAQTRDTK